MAPLQRGAAWSLRASARALTARRLDLHVEGLEHLPRSGPLLIASRHYHHLYDGCALLAAVPRPVHLLVALDWTTSKASRRRMEWACAAARWPVALREQSIITRGRASAYSADEALRYLRRAVRDSVILLRAGRALAIFPEGYPTIDPNPSPKGADEFLPFRPGFAAIAEAAQGDGHTRVPIVPAGFNYQQGPRWRVVLRFGPPLYAGTRADRARLLRCVEEQVRQLSELPSAGG